MGIYTMDNAFGGTRRPEAAAATSTSLPTAGALPPPSLSGEESSFVALAQSTDTLRANTKERRLLKEFRAQEGQSGRQLSSGSIDPEDSARLQGLQKRVRYLQKQLDIPYDQALDLVTRYAEKGTMALAKAPFRQTAIVDRLHNQPARSTAQVEHDWEALKARSSEMLGQAAAKGAADAASSSAKAVMHTAETAAMDAESVVASAVSSSAKEVHAAETAAKDMASAVRQYSA